MHGRLALALAFLFALPLALADPGGLDAPDAAADAQPRAWTDEGGGYRSDFFGGRLDAGDVADWYRYDATAGEALWIHVFAFSLDGVDLVVLDAATDAEVLRAALDGPTFSVTRLQAWTVVAPGPVRVGVVDERGQQGDNAYSVDVWTGPENDYAIVDLQVTSVLGEREAVVTVRTPPGAHEWARELRIRDGSLGFDAGGTLGFAIVTTVDVVGPPEGGDVVVRVPIGRVGLHDLSVRAELDAGMMDAHAENDALVAQGPFV